MTELELMKLDEEMFGAYMDHNIDLILSHCSDDVYMHDFGSEPVKGKEAARAYLAGQFAAFSGDKGSHIKRLIGDHEVFAEVDWTATNTGPIPMPDGSSIPATGKDIEVRVAYYARVNDDGEVVELRGYPDVGSMMMQLGLMGG